jgi:site-specific DNA-methyltransferase (adenine-specific)/adenine-specific DNA-methyltransferase
MNKSNKQTPKFYKQRLTEQKSIWDISPKVNLPHPAPFPEGLVEQCILSTTDVGDVVLDPFMGIGTTAVVADRLGRKYIGFDVSQEYIDIAKGNITLGKIRKTKEL